MIKNVLIQLFNHNFIQIKMRKATEMNKFITKHLMLIIIPLPAVSIKGMGISMKTRKLKFIHPTIVYKQKAENRMTTFKITLIH